MRNKFLLMLFAFTIFVNMTVTAQKIGYFDTNYVLPQLPEFKQADAELKVYEKQLQDELQNKRKDYETKYKALEAGVNTMTDVVKETKIKELQALEGQIVEFQQSAQQKFQEKSAKMMEPIYTKLEKTITDVSKENSFVYIFKKEALLYELPENNISDLVLKKLGVTPTSPK